MIAFDDPNFTGALQCDPRAIYQNMTKEEVIALCGEPWRKFYAFEGIPPVKVDRWLYEGWNYLIFTDDKLSSVDLKDRDNGLSKWLEKKK